MSEFEDTTAIVTGGSSGIGRESALAFARQGADVVVADVDRDGGEAIVTEIEEMGRQSMFIPTDVSDSDEVASMIEQTVDELGSLEYAHNNAGIRGERHEVHEYPRDAWEDVVDINLTGVFECLKQEAQAMVDQDGGGVIVNTASITAETGLPLGTSYSAAKHGVLGLTRTAAIDLAKYDVRVNAVCPGYIETPMLTESDGDRVLDDDTRDRLESLQPMGRLGQPEEIAAAVTYLCSDDASFVTGESINVDGGYMAGKQ